MLNSQNIQYECKRDNKLDAQLENVKNKNPNPIATILFWIYLSNIVFRIYFHSNVN